MKKPIRLSIIASLLLGGSGVTVSLLPIMGHAEAPTTQIYTVESRTSLYQIALQSGLNLRELRQLNKGSLDSRDTLNAGESLLLPANSPLFPVDPLAGKVIASDLPELGMGNDPVPLNGVGAGEQKTASVAQTVGAQDWNNMTSDQMKNQAENWAKNKAKAQMVAPLGTYFGGRVLTLSVSAPVTLSSLTGEPRSGTPNLHSATYTLHVPELPLPITGVLVGGVEYPVTSGFPVQGFVGAAFQIRLGDNVTNNMRYTWSTAPQSDWVSVDSQGRVSFIAEASSATRTVVIKATDKVGGGESTYAFTVNEWFINQGATPETAVGADGWCAAQPGGTYSVPGWTRLSAGPGTARAGDGPLWNAWGRLSAYGAGWSDYSYWASETQGGDRYDVYLATGNVGHNPPGSQFFVTCSRML